MRPARQPLVVVAIAGLCALGGCGGSASDGARSDRGGVGGPASVVATRGADGVQRVTVEGRDTLTFVPSTIEAAPGPVALTLKNAGNVPHDLVLSGLGSTSIGNVNGGEAKTVTFTATQAGTYPFVCSYHEGSGMRGRLVIR